MKVPILTAVLLGLVLTPVLAGHYQQTNGKQEIIIGDNTHIDITDVAQTVKIISLTRTAIIEQRSNQLSWKTIWNYNTGVIATKVLQENTCYISVMNRTEMPSFENLPRLAAESRKHIGFLRPTTKITFVTSGLVNNLNTYGADIIAMCSGVITYHGYEVHGIQMNLGPCLTLNVLRVVELKYCNSNGGQNVQTGEDHQIIIGGDSHISIGGGDSHISISGVSQSMNINSQTQEAIIEQRSNQLSWKTIWNYNTGVIATKVLQENTCYISVMNRTEMPSFGALVRVAAQGGNMISLGQPTRKITFVSNGLVNNLNSYGANTIAMCSGVTTYHAYEVYGPNNIYNPQSCIALHVLRLVELRYCNNNGQNVQVQSP